RRGRQERHEGRDRRRHHGRHRFGGGDRGGLQQGRAAGAGREGRRRGGEELEQVADRRGDRGGTRRRLMGQKVNPYGFRLGVTTDWKSRWFADREEYADFIIEDWKIRDYLMGELPHAAISRVEVER